MASFAAAQAAKKSELRLMLPGAAFAAAQAAKKHIDEQIT